MKNLLVGLCVVMSVGAFAQYKYTGPDGRVVYTDTPPPDAKNLKPVKTQINVVDNAQPLPAKLRELQAQLPVVLYTTRECDTCNVARSFLQKRGIPYSEKTVNSTDDFAAYKGINAEPKFPLITIGREKQLGVDEAKLNMLLDSAGYPKESILPKNYRFPVGAALVGDDGVTSTKKANSTPKAKKADDKPPVAAPSATPAPVAPAKPDAAGSAKPSDAKPADAKPASTDKKG